MKSSRCGHERTTRAAIQLGAVNGETSFVLNFVGRASLPARPHDPESMFECLTVVLAINSRTDETRASLSFRLRESFTSSQSRRKAEELIDRR